VFQGDGGYLHADRAHAALLADAREGGVEVSEQTQVAGLELGRGSVHLSLANGELVAGAVVVTAGAWAPRLLGPIGVELPVVPTRETVVYVDLPGAENLPPLIDYAGIPAPGEGGIARPGNSTFSLAAPGAGLKAGLHHAGPVTDPDQVGTVDESVAAWVSRWAASRYEHAGERLGAETCIYTNTADESFVLERHGRVVVGSACSGHGFKFAPVVGRNLAALALEAAG
jgi:sarcosine oxidase